MLAEMNKKLKYNPEDRFICLVAEPRNSIFGTTQNNDNKTGESTVAGVIEVSYIDEKEVLSSLDPGTTGVAYIQSMAVDPALRRQGIASTMLSAAERVAREWAEQLAVLHVYQDNTKAIELYKKAGFAVIFQDAPWLAKLAVRPRFLMRKDF